MKRRRSTQIRHPLFDQTSAPVIRTRVRVYDDPERPLALERFANIADDQQKADFAALGMQQGLFLLFYDEQVWHRLSKRMAHTATPAIAAILRKAEELRAKILADQSSFDQAKADVMRVTTM